MKIPKFEAQTEWNIPTEFPDLRQVDEIAIDLETRDPDLIKKGSGSVIGNGEVIGIAVATKHYKGYFPIAHEGGGNMDRKRVLSWLKDILEAPPTDGLWDNDQTDEDQIGATYEELEWAMKNKETKNLSKRQQEVIEIYNKFHAANKHKMMAIPVCNIPDNLKSK